MEAEAAVQGINSQELEADAFRRLYPTQYHERFFAAGIRHDGRPLGRARAVSIVPGPISCADGSATVKLGSSTALSGIRLELYRPEGSSGELNFNVELAQFSKGGLRQNRQGEAELCGSTLHRLRQVFIQADVFNCQQLCVAPGKAAWRVHVDVYVLDADGAVFDACLLAVVAALLDAKLPPIKQTSEGSFARSKANDSQALLNTPTHLQLGTVPLSVTCCLHGEYLLVDPTAEEEQLAATCMTTVVDGTGRIHGLFHAGGAARSAPSTHQKCIEAAKSRWKEVHGLLGNALRVGG